MRFRFIEDRRADYPVTVLCDVLGHLLETSLTDFEREFVSKRLRKSCQRWKCSLQRCRQDHPEIHEQSLTAR
jgi:hypothetical protein